MLPTVNVLVVHLMLLSSASAAVEKSLLGEALRSQRAFLKHLRAEPRQAANILQGLDTNHDGHADLSEVAAFAVRQGLDVESTKKDFSGMDMDHDGVLSIAEISTALGGPKGSSATSDEPTTISKEPAPEKAIHFEQPVNLQSRNSQLSQQTSTDMSISKVAEQLALEQKLLEEAVALDTEASELRGRKKALQQETSTRAMTAAMLAADQQSSKLLKSITSLQDQAQVLEIQASTLRAKLRADLKQADELMTIAGMALQQGPK